MTVADLIEILQKERLTKRIYISREYALVEAKKDDVTIQQWGIIFG